jgi:outer membrane protein OmpA-like peptidoglycan-associated protein
VFFCFVGLYKRYTYFSGCKYCGAEIKGVLKLFISLIQQSVSEYFQPIVTNWFSLRSMGNPKTMKKIVLSLSLVAGATTFAQTANQTSLSIYFAKDSYDLSDASMQLLDSLRTSVTDPAEELLLLGHTDSDASVAYNKELSLNRTRAVQNYLFDHDFHNRIHIDWKGEAKPVNGNMNETEKTLNRRVEVVRNYKDPNNFVERFKKPAETFVINPNRDTLIVGREGTRIFIPAGSFRTKDPNVPIEIQLTEFYKMSDFVLNDLSTTTTINELLESGGTINIEAFSGNEKLELDDLATIQVSFMKRQDMQLFQQSLIIL